MKDIAKLTLQWGRTLSSAEVRKGSTLLRTEDHASMGPHSFKCGSTNQKLTDQKTDCASMGPHSFKCGSKVSLSHRHLSISASMGPHSFKCGSSERRPGVDSRFTCFNGAALFQVRKLPLYFHNSEKNWGFNGAALFQVRKSGISLAGIFMKAGFNGAALFQVRKYLRRNKSATIIGLASMGPHSFKCGSNNVPIIRKRRGPASMGPHSFKCGSRT